ncbi:unnamed protein product [Oikopleura dioica]|uniref:Conserved oligomeric Golgi complex subunit 3 n=1 Tax=Oikopleura dioica TaxID=34765 RepID=E4X756_OIKDI|nr:unnamed protein product [Oikopleura dioica]
MSDSFEWWESNRAVVESIKAFAECFDHLQENATKKELPRSLPVQNKGQNVTELPPMVPNSDEECLVNGMKNAGVRPIDDGMKLLDWFTEVENEMSHNVADPVSEAMLNNLESDKNFSRAILRSVDSALGSLNAVSSEYVSVRSKTCALHEACESLLLEQTRLTDSAEAIHEKLSYFEERDGIRAALKNPKLEVNSEAFLALLSRIDSCISYMSQNSQFKDAPIFLMQFNQCLTQALGQIKTHVMRSFETTTNQLLERKITKTYSNSSLTDDAFTLYYGRFRTNAPKIKTLVALIESRSEGAAQYGQALTDIYTCYCAQREQLISPGVTSSFNDLRTGRDVCGLVRASCAFMLHVCQDEHQLFRHFFTLPSSALDEMLERLCQGLYDLLRPFIISIYHLETLAELCSILKLEMIDDHISGNPTELGAFEVIVKQMLEDVQERLVYRTNIYIKSDILGFNPSQGDLAYPEKLQMMEDIAKKLHTSMSSSPADLHGMWYPTVRRVLVCLSKLYRCIERGIFQGLSQEALSSCVESLTTASNQIKLSKSEIDGQLFLVKHLLILREQIAPFHADFSIRETRVDFEKTKSAANRLLQSDNISRIFNVNHQNSLLEFMLEGRPEVKEYFVDSKKHVDRQLKLACEDFISSRTAAMIGQLQEFLTRAEAVVELSRRDAQNTKVLKENGFAKTESMQQLCSDTYALMKKKMTETQASMRLYLANKDTETILFKPIRLNIQAVFSRLQLLLWEHYSTEDRAIINAPTPEQVSLLLQLQI